MLPPCEQQSVASPTHARTDDVYNVDVDVAYELCARCTVRTRAPPQRFNRCFLLVHSRTRTHARTRMNGRVRRGAHRAPRASNVTGNERAILIITIFGNNLCAHAHAPIAKSLEPENRLCTHTTHAQHSLAHMREYNDTCTDHRSHTCRRPLVAM